MEFMDDEVLDPVAALSLNLKDSAPLPDPTLCGLSTFGFDGLHCKGLLPVAIYLRRWIMPLPGLQ